MSHHGRLATCLALLCLGTPSLAGEEAVQIPVLDDMLPGQVRRVHVRFTSGASLRLRCRFEGDVAAVTSGAPLRSVRRDPAPEELDLDAERIARVRWFVDDAGDVRRRRLAFELEGGRDGGRVLAWTSPPIDPAGAAPGREAWWGAWKIEYRAPGAPLMIHGETDGWIVDSSADGVYMNVQLGADDDFTIDDRVDEELTLATGRVGIRLR